MDRIGVGIIGASVTNPGWATAVHVPAIMASKDFALRAVSTSSAGSAAAASTRFGVPAFDNADALIAAPDVALVVVAVKVPHHSSLISKALAAGKMVFSEWPLAENLPGAETLAAQASSTGLYSVIGLQARFSPAIARARELVRSGCLGEVLATSIAGSGMAWGDKTDAAHAYMFQAGSGASTLSVPLMHALDAVVYVLGDFQQIAAISAIRRRTVVVSDRAEAMPNTSPDHVALACHLRSGAVASVFYRGGTSRAGNFRWEINGTAGDLLLTGANGNVQVADLELRAGYDEALDLDHLVMAPESPALSGNVARLYETIAADIRGGTRSAPDFAIALERHRLLASIEASAAQFKQHERGHVAT